MPSTLSIRKTSTLPWPTTRCDEKNDKRILGLAIIQTRKKAWRELKDPFHFTCLHSIYLSDIIREKTDKDFPISEWPLNRASHCPLHKRTYTEKGEQSVPGPYRALSLPGEVTKPLFRVLLSLRSIASRGAEVFSLKRVCVTPKSPWRLLRWKHLVAAWKPKANSVNVGTERYYTCGTMKEQTQHNHTHPEQTLYQTTAKYQWATRAKLLFSAIDM